MAGRGGFLYYGQISEQRGKHDWDHARDTKDQVWHDASPFDELDDTAAEEGLAARVPVAVVEDVGQLHDASREEADQQHQHQAYVESPEANTDIFFDACPLFIVEHLTQGER